MSTRWVSLSGVLLCLALSACTGGGRGQRSAISGTPYGSAGEYRIQPLDTIHVTVFQESNLTQKFKVSQLGAITYPLVGPIQVGGLTVPEAEKKITAALARDYLVNPQVTITVEAYSSRRVTIMGQVKSPGTYEIPAEERLTLLQAIAKAGDFTTLAARNRVRIIRAQSGKNQTIRVNVAAILNSGDQSRDVELLSGDVIIVPETFF